MAIALVQQITGTVDSNNTDFTLTLGETPVEGNVLFAFISKDGANSITPASGWTEVDDRADDGSSSRHGVYWKVAVAAEAKAHTWSSSPEKWAGGIYELSGVDTSTPVDGTPVFGTGSSTSPTSPTFTPSVSGVMVMAGAGNNNYVDPFTPNASLDYSWGEETTPTGSCAAGGGLDLRSDTSATGTYVHTISGSNDWVAYTVGAAPTEQVELDADPASLIVSGSDVSLEGPDTLDADSASFTVTASEVTLSAPFGWWTPTWWGSEWWLEPWWGRIEANRTLAADSAAYTVSGADVDLNKGRTLLAASASFAVTGGSVDLHRSIEPATFTVTASDVTLTYRSLPAETASITVTPATDVELTYTPLVTRQINIDAATFNVTASDVELDQGYVLDAATAAFTATGSAVDLDVDTELYALGETFSVSASDVSLESSQGYTFPADSASFSVTASDITFSKSAVTVTFGQYDKTNIIKPEPHGVRISPEGEGFFFR